MGAGKDDGRYAHLTQPIRDVAKAWAINVSDELEAYREELRAIDEGEKELEDVRGEICSLNI
jgi:hypothetical protein